MVNIKKLVEYDPTIAFKINSICEILHTDGYYPKAKIYETAIAILTEVS